MPDDCPMSATLLRRRSHGVGLSILDHLARIALTSPRVVTKSCTSGRAGGLICEPLKAVWPAYAGIVTRIFLVDRASYLLSLVPLCTLDSGLHPAPPLTRNSPSPKSSAPQSSSPDP